jgi:hypothetical protein
VQSKEHICMSNPTKKNRHYADVSFEKFRSTSMISQCVRMSLSWVLNTIVHEYARFIERKNLAPLESRVGRRFESPPLLIEKSPSEMAPRAFFCALIR